MERAEPHVTALLQHALFELGYLRQPVTGNWDPPTQKAYDDYVEALAAAPVAHPVRPDATHYGAVADALRKGRLVPFFGAGVNLSDRSSGERFERGVNLPSGAELAAYLVNEITGVGAHIKGRDTYDLVRVSQCITTMRDEGTLYDELHDLFAQAYEPTGLHTFFAELPSKLRGPDGTAPSLLIVTTNYDYVMEAAFEKADQPFHLVEYVAEGEEEQGKFRHTRPKLKKAQAPEEGEPEAKKPEAEELIKVPNTYSGIALNARRHFDHPVLLKIHGAVHRDDVEKDSYVITEDDYIDYMARADLSNLIPAVLLEKLKQSSFLFLGYGLRDWNLRVILQRIWGQQRIKRQSWAVQLNPSPLDQRFWMKRGVDIIPTDLKTYLAGLRTQLP